jgi:hypothetical protein
VTVTTTIIAKTAYGAPIECFSSRERADLWIETEGDRFPGWFLEVVTETRKTFRAVLAADELERAA